MEQLDFLILETTIDAENAKRRAYKELDSIVNQIETNKEKLLADAQWIEQPLQRFLEQKEQYNIAQAKLGIYKYIKENMK